MCARGVGLGEERTKRVARAGARRGRAKMKEEQRRRTEEEGGGVRERER